MGGHHNVSYACMETASRYAGKQSGHPGCHGLDVRHVESLSEALHDQENLAAPGPEAGRHPARGAGFDGPGMARREAVG